MDRWRSSVCRANTEAVLAVSSEIVSSMLEHMLNNYIGLWRGDWGVINQIYIVIYSTVLYPMMLYLAYTLIKGIYSQKK